MLPVGLDYAAFDVGVNSDHCRRQRLSWWRRVLIVDYCEERMRFLRSLGGKNVFRRTEAGRSVSPARTRNGSTKTS